MSTRRVRGIFRKELREYRRNRQIVLSMAVLPLVFSVYPSIEILALPASASGALVGKQPLIYMLALPAIVPAVVAAYSVAGGVPRRHPDRLLDHGVGAPLVLVHGTTAARLQHDPVLRR